MASQCNKYQWQGERVKTEFGYCKVTENKEKPLYWYNFECNWDDYNDCQSNISEVAYIPAIKVTYGDQSFCIANHHGIGVHKLINGGWPSYRHYSLPVDVFEPDMTKEESMIYRIYKFDLEAFEEHESKRRSWQKKNYPEEFERSEALRRTATRKEVQND